MKVAIIHYWWLTNRGGESVVTSLLEMFPNADLFLHVLDENLVKNTLGSNFTGKINTTFISKLPNAKKYYQFYLPFMPIALEQLNLDAYDLIISSESGPAKGIITRPDAIHICYCHSPMRYLWDMYHDYLNNANYIVRIIFPVISHWLRVWDRVSADRVDYFLANSTFIKSRISKYYRRDSQIVFPPVRTEQFSSERCRSNSYLYLGQLVGYKRPDLAINSFNRLGLPLIVIGEGEMFNKLKKIANKNITFLGWQSFENVKLHLETCKALIFPGTEDFGIVPIEAMAAGAPVIAFARGGILDSVIDGETGIYFHQQTVESLCEAVNKLESNLLTFSSQSISKHASMFNSSKFKSKINKIISDISINTLKQ